ncbi:molybdopterin cofactor-binding domain-containing protein [Rhodoferax sp. TS-BS-61-7]|uniref:xanthine dehydrogenase family protein molybdopterin-binding subunit n=1 Tax=Rhodoferax sp. TS-BS-61-7 TaxID=2094194 RepID=UPI000CF6EB7A|nr:molybdopterin cofactor-binding domain-containing protein [Rhodoferax sp. TS-BS-61-7]PQA75941.1 xanthine dehydrogenase family protein molybdopterin-binding subunit [Rhodoferax sp. TS-BS-61-7]
MDNSRRNILKGCFCFVAFSMLGFEKPTLAQQIPRGTLSLNRVDSFLALRPDGSLIIYSGKVDLGTGHRIAMRQMVGEELSLPVARIDLVEGDTALTPNQGPTVGSTGVMRGGIELRLAAATLREEILALASKRLGANASSMELRDGLVFAADGRILTIAELTVTAPGEFFPLKLMVNKNAALKLTKDYVLVGKSLPRPDVPAKVTGQHVFLQDFTLPSMLHARVLRPPAMNAALMSINEPSIGHLPNTRVLRINNFLAVIAVDEWAAIRAARELKTQWSEGDELVIHEDVPKWVRAGPFIAEETLFEKGNVERQDTLRSDSQRHQATYYWPMQSHGSIGPSCSVADVKADSATIWTSSQASHRLIAPCAAALGMPASNIRIVYIDGAGCYGMNGHDDASIEAAMISQALGRPVRVQWSRQDELGWDPKGPPQLLELSANLTSDGHIDTWSTEMWFPRATAQLPWIPLLSPQAAGLPQPRGLATGQISQNGNPPYIAKSVRVLAHWLDKAPLRPAHIRAPGKVANCFAVESFVDELASRARIDALEFRLRDLEAPRGREVLQRLASLMNWKIRPSPAPDRRKTQVRGRGMAYIHYKDSEAFVAVGMEVAVDRRSGMIRVERVACVHDCGLMINPDAVRAQVEGNILQTLSRTLHEETTCDRDRVTSVDWASYPLLRFPEVPQLDIELLQRLDHPPVGAGEASSAPVPAALGNAVFDATGVRVRSVPFLAARLKLLLA